MVFLYYLLAAAAAAAPLTEPFAWLNGLLPTTTAPLPHSPDPLVATRWASSVNSSVLQVYASPPVEAWGVPATGARGAANLVGNNGSCAVSGGAALVVDFGVERAGWFEFRLDGDASGLLAAISEYDYPWTGKTMAPVAYDGGWYRLETNGELYEGARYAFLFPKAAVDVLEARVVARVRAVNYTGSFRSSDATLEKSWYAAAYGARLNMNADDFGSILMDRGDRVSIQGDGHPTMAAALAAFGAPATWDLVKLMLNKTDSGCAGCRVVDDSLMSYPVLWTMSVNDYYWASGDAETFARFAPDVATILDKALATFLATPPVEFMGWDDRLDNGFCGECTGETRLAFSGLLVRAVSDFAQLLGFPKTRDASPAAAELARRYARAAENATRALRASEPAYGLHSAAYAMTARTGLVTAGEAEALVSSLFRGAAAACSWSPFNSFWILQALGDGGFGDDALAYAKLCWGGMLELTNGCFLELFSPEWLRFSESGDKLPTKPSECHPWSSGVAPWLTKVAAGLSPLDPGYGARALVAPLFWGCAGAAVAGAVAAPAGDVAVDATCVGGVATVAASAPRGVAVVVGLRKTLGDGCVLTGAFVDHEAAPLLDAETSGAAAGMHPLNAAGHAFVRANGTVTAAYDCPSDVSDGTAPTYPPPKYAAAVAPLDRATGGRWPGAYGGDGYALFGIDGAERLPSYVSNVTAYKHEPKRTTYAANETAAAARLCVDAACSARALGSLGEGCGDGCQGTVLDVSLDGPPASLRVSLYFVDAPASDDRDDSPLPVPTPGGGAASVVRALDLATGSLVAPEEKIADFAGGAYWTLAYAKGVRLRIMPLYGSARVSAIFFDSS